MDCLQIRLGEQPSNEQSAWQLICAIIYTTAWALSFYGQLFQNWKAKSVEGFSLNYLCLNIMGYTMYGIYTNVGYFTDVKGAGTVVLLDVINVNHSIVLVAMHTIQAIVYPVIVGLSKKGRNRLSKYAIAVIVGMWLLLATEIISSEFLQVIPNSEYWNPLMLMGYFKLSLTFKCTHQIYWNFKRKSTEGWSVFMIIADLIGGVFSFASGTISVEDGLNKTKLFLGVLSIIFDLIFLFQHYCLYRNNKPQQDQIQQSQPLIQNTPETDPQ